MRSCVADGQTDRQTDRQTDGAGYIGPAEGYGGSKKYQEWFSLIEQATYCLSLHF